MASKFKQISLSDLVQGEHGSLLSLAAGDAIINRLASLGFTPGAGLSMTQNYGRGPLIVTVRGARVALGRVEAAKIFVERTAE